MPTTSTSQLITGRVIKTKNSHSVNTSSQAALESNIGKSLLSESSIADGAAEFDGLAGTSTNIGSHHRAEDFANDHIHVITSDDLTNRNYVVVANYVSNEDTTPAGEVTNPVRINATTSTTVTSKVLDDSSAYKNTSIKVTLTDPYFTDPEFSDSNNNYSCTFDTTNASNLIYTRNVNTNSAHNDYSSTITASEYTAWNTQDGYGSYFINGVVSIDSTTGEPSASLYAEDASLNFLSKNFTVDLYESNPNIVPIFGRYQVVFSQSGENTVTVTPFGSSSLVLTTDLTSWDSFVNSTYLDTNVPLTNLPISINSTELEKWVLNNQFVSTGFTLQISSTEFTSVATFNNSSYSAPVNIDLANMNFNTKNFYILEKSMETNAAAGSSTLAIEKAINDTTYQNKLTVTNGSLSLVTNFDVDSGYYTLLDGYEALESDDLIGGQNGIIQSYNSARVANASDSETVFPRASRSAVSSSYGILENFAVQYNSDESGYVEDVEALTGDNLTHAVTYAITTLAGQTTTEEGSSNWSDVIGVNNEALAIVKDSNTSISSSDITFFSNSNTYSNNNDNKLSVIDIVCNKVWSESKVYATDETVISGLTADIKSFNMESVPLNLKDIRFILTAKSLINLSLEPSGNWVLSCPDSVLTTSSEKLGVMDDSTITEKLLTEEDNILGSLFVTIYPRIESMLASKFTKFHYNLETSYQDIPQITYDDEFTILNYSKSSVTTSPEITNFLNVPANTKLYKRSYTESFNVKVPFRYGYYNNLFLTSDTLSYDIEYYVLTDNNNINADLPRYYLNGVKDNNDDDIYATVTPTTSTVSTSSTNIGFTNKDFKPYNISLQKKTGTDWVDVTPDAPAYADLWYNTRSTISSPIGSFYLSLTLPPNVNSLSNPTFYIDLELDKGTSSFTISGKQFTATDLDSMSSTNLNTFDLAGTSYGTAITGLGNVTYARDSDVAPNTQASTTLTAGGYVFKLLAEMYLSIRIFVCPNGIFKRDKTSDGTSSTTYHNIVTIAGTDSLNLDTGVYGYGDLREAIRGTSSATWSLNNDAIQATYYGTTGFSYQRITSLNQEFRPVDNARGFETTIVRGFTPNLSTTITRTLSEVQLDLAGYTFDTDLLNNINDELTFGGITMSSNSATYSMYPANFGTQTWTINLSYGSYTLSDKVDTDSNPVESIVYAYKSIISDRRGLKILSTSLNTNNFSYIVQYTSQNALTIRRNPDINAPDYSVNSTGYSVVNTFTPEQLRDASLNNLVGNILDIHYIAAGTIPDMNCQFSITPPYLKFTAIDPSNVSTIPFDSSLQTPVTRYMRVNNVNTTTPGTYNPFSSHSSINNITFAQQNVKQYLAYFIDSDSQIDYMNVDNYNIEVELGSGLDSSTAVTDWTTVYGPTPILNSDFSNNNIDITAPDSSRKFQIFIDQQNHPSFSNFFVYDASFAEYNLQLEIGSSFISGPSNGENSIILEFVAGDSTSLDLYAVEKFEKVSDNLEVTFAKYTSGAGISNQFLQTTVANGLNLPYTSKYTKTVSTPLNSTASLTSTITTLSDHLTSLKTSISASTFSAWTSASVGSGSPKLTFAPATTTGRAQLVRFLTHGPIVTRSILSLVLEDHTRIEDIYGVPNYRVTYNGSTHSSSLNLKQSFSQSNLNSALPTATNL
jgi:hypothetical protein